MPKARAVAPAAYINIPLTAVHVRRKQAVFQQLVKVDLQEHRTSAPCEVRNHDVRLTFWLQVDAGQDF